MSKQTMTHDTISAAHSQPDSGSGPSKVSFIARGHLVLWVKTQVESDYDLDQVAVPP